MSLILDGSTGVSDVDGSAATPAIRGTDANTGMFFPAADTIAFSEGGVESMRIDSSGNVGIGTSSPAFKLDVVGNTNTPVTLASQNSNSGVSATARFLAISDGGNAQLAACSSAYTDVTGAADSMMLNANSMSNGIVFATDGVIRMKLDTSGNLGIGTSSPLTPLHVVGAIQSQRSGAAQYARMLNSAGTATFISDNQASGTYTGFQFQGLSTASGTPVTYATIDGSGNVGIGLTPSYRLDVAATGSVVARFARTSFAAAHVVNAATETYFSADASGNNGFGADATNGRLVFWANSAERMRILSNGNVSIGTTSSSGKLYVANTANDHAARFDTTFNNFSSVNVFSVLFGTNTNTTSCNHFNGYADGANRILIYGNGNIQNQNNSYAGISDIKLKENVTDTAPKLDKLNQVRVVNYNLKDSPDQKLLGVVAQELEQIFPNMVEETVDRDIDGNLLETTTKSVKYSVFVPMLIKAIQELKAELDSVKAELQTLKGA